MASLPSGTVTFLFTDIEGSTRLAQQHPDSVAALLERHHIVLKRAIEAHGGYIFQIIGDAFCAAFQTAQEALDAAIEAQRTLAAENWSPEPLRVRMGLSTGTAQVRMQDGRPPDYSGYLSMARVQRIMSLAHGGQILLSGASAELLRSELQSSVTLRDLGEHRLKGFLHPERLWQVVAPGLQLNFPPLVSLHATPDNLPLQLTSFVGRQHEMADIKKLLATHRLVTLTGSGGTGKTRLALQIAPDLLDGFPDGAWLVELAPIRDGELIPQTVLRTLGLTAESKREPLEVLKDYLAGKSLLILLDNCEHLLAACCSVLTAVLRAAPGVQIVTTSREPLNLAGEQVYRVPSLSTPDVRRLPSVEQLTQFEAVHLFIERAALASPGFGMTDSNARAVAQICQQLDGIPLAIELAAARLKSMPLETLTSHLDDRFRLLTGGSRNALPRQQTLRSTIDWSYALLNEPERLLLQRLSVFRGGWTLEAAEAVCSDEGIERLEVLDLLSKLVDKSLVNLDEGSRYQMLETVRQYASEKLIDAGQAEWARDRHVHFMLDFAERSEPEVRGHNQLLWLDQLEAELDNWRAARAWAQDRDSVSYLRLAAALWRFWAIRVGDIQIIEWLTGALSRTEGLPSVARARALARLAFLSVGGFPFFYHNPGAQHAALQASDLGTQLQDKPTVIMALNALARGLILQKPGEAVTVGNRALSLSRELGDHWLTKESYATLGIEAGARNDLTAAVGFFEQAVVEARLSGDNRFIAMSLMELARVNRAQGNVQKTQALLHEALPITRLIGDRANTAICHGELALIAIQRRDYARAQQLLEEGLALATAIDHRFAIAYTLRDFAVLEWARGNGSAVCERAQASESAARQAREPSLAAQALGLLGEGYRLRGEIDSARLQYTKALAASQAEFYKEGYCLCLQGLGAVALACGQPQRAVRLFAARTKLCEKVYAEDYYPFMVREREELLSKARAGLSEEAFAAAWVAGQAISEEEMLAYALESGSSS